MRIGIVVDATCDLPPDFLARHKVVVMPITLRFGDRLLEDARDPVATRLFYAAQADGQKDDFAESTAFSPEQIEQLFLERLVVDYDYVFCLTITSARSPIYDHALQASRSILNKYRTSRRAAGLPDRFGLAVVNSRNMFAGQGVQAAEAIRLKPDVCHFHDLDFVVAVPPLRWRWCCRSSRASSTVTPCACRRPPVLPPT